MSEVAESAKLMGRLLDCMEHLSLLENDRDACQALHDNLFRLAALFQEGDGSLATFAERMALALGRLLYAEQGLQGPALMACKACLDLLGWQVELNDPHMDDAEQAELLARLAECCTRALHGATASAA
ncbi:hypothetical protein [Pseudomonas sp. DC3000-4b1]|uniref:hypothetical protein n=1 Tax=unclassified Pseudomonas TaxID=196821 RepID=UPI003CEEC18D